MVTIRLQRVIWVMMIAVLLVSLEAISIKLEGAERHNLLKNGDFESWTKRGLPSGWLFLAGQTRKVISHERKSVKSGNSSVKINLSGENNSAIIGSWIYNIYPDTEYLFTGYVKGKGNVTLKVVVEGNLGSIKVPLSSEWKEFRFPFNSQEATRILPEFRCRGIGTIWIDNCQLIKIGKPGASVLPNRRQLVKLLSYQRNPVSPDKNTDEWVKTYIAPQNKLLSIKEAISTLGKAENPQWRVGQWVRYEVFDDIIIPSTKPEKRRQISVIECALEDKEKIGGRDYWWYVVTIKMDKYWVAQSFGRYDTGRKILLKRKRKVVLKFLVDGPEFSDIHRYLLKIDDEPLIEYTDGKRAMLPVLSIEHALIKPKPQQGEKEKIFLPNFGVAKVLKLKEKSSDGERIYYTNSNIPVTGIVGYEIHSSFLDRKAYLINFGRYTLKNKPIDESPLVLKLPRKPWLAISTEVFEGYNNLGLFRKLYRLGINLFEDIRGVYLGERRRFFNQTPVYFYSRNCWDVDIFDICRSNFLGFRSHLDEPYQRQRKRFDYFRPKEVNNMSDASRRYVSAIRKLYKNYNFWPGQRIKSYNSPPGCAWFDMKAGADGFIFEHARLKDEIEYLKNVVGGEIGQDIAEAIDMASITGAANTFKKPWGIGIYRQIPRDAWIQSFLTARERGAFYLGFWVANREFMDSIMDMLPQITRALNRKWTPKQSTVALVIPNNFVFGLSGTWITRPWGVLDYPEGEKINAIIAKKAVELYRKGIIFDILLDDPEAHINWSKYKEVIHISETFH